MVTRSSSRGFTLIELLVVMALIGMLLSLSVPRYFGNVDKAKESVLRQNLAQTRDAIDKYFGDNGRYPDSLDEIVARRYLRKLPVDPITDRSDSWVIVAPEKKDMGAVFDVRSGAAGRARDGSEYASW
ncbi:type II secretion system protein [Janthinobacterium lividum]|uniref:type II secretion system protein n=1 Tax=Janthinobacterium lividum TaxID=29581 RepID=UPI000873F3A3|nr:prepilin-type N-terminal cleavage/methylation domain-containing protein [Janthinobacterium lividum]MCC7716722.1 prepilin-type N-terminal cleavage/methylation domain-containing protein [Janthinobacterium lividum]OEZ54270.1 type II secretion system protein G precursor [Janthinobacterium lividum]WQE31790.1 prepilin-type N-terminal cleavage/methylation domain-containing protein [Janthinobacterium lividum]STS86058.1 PilD-dependent protein pddA [Janthinobacterium lividum]